jgi:hypothetical protein
MVLRHGDIVDVACELQRTTGTAPLSDEWRRAHAQY